MKRFLILFLILLVSCSNEPTPYERFEMDATRNQGQRLKSTAESRNDQLDSLRTDLVGQTPLEIPPPDAAPPDSIGVELLWKVPNENVIAYHFYYGTRPNELSEHVRVPVERIEKLAHPVYGTVFRYRLRGAFPEEELFVSIRAENDQGLSPVSREIRIPVSHSIGVDSKGIDARDRDRRY